jgi:hypothetical protein
LFVHGHADYHPKNIIIGQDRPDDPTGRFGAYIDFDSCCQLPPAFEVGTFPAQYRRQLHAHLHVLGMAPPHVVLDAYLRLTGQPREPFMVQVELFQARTALSIIGYLVEVGLGESGNLWELLLDAERSLTRFTAGRHWLGFTCGGGSPSRRMLADHRRCAGGPSVPWPEQRDPGGPR